MRRFLDALGRFLTWFSVAGFILMLLVTWFQILSRYTAVGSAQWTEEAARLLFVFTMMFGIVVAIRNREHIVVDFFTYMMPKRMQRVLSFAFNLATLLFLAILFRGAINLSHGLWRASLITIDSLTKGHLYAIEAIAVGLMFIYVLADMVVPAADDADEAAEGLPQ